MEHFLKLRLKAAGKSQDELGDVLNRDKGAISRVINGKQDLQLRQLEPVAKFLGISVSELLIGLGIDPGRPALDMPLLSDSLKSTLKYKGMPPALAEEMALMVTTIYQQAFSNAAFRTPDAMAALADALVTYAQSGARK